jgi:ABC-type branched-subunit amino acid transport system substrate-binding protein
MTINIFLASSLSSMDIRLRDKLIQQLQPLVQQNVVTLWHHGKIGPGSNKKAKIKEQIDHADIALLLVSSDFVTDPECCEEVDLIMERHHAGKMRVVPIILRPVDWRGQPYGGLSPLPPNGNPIVSGGNDDSQVESKFFNVATEVKKLIQVIQAEKKEQPAHTQITLADRQETNLNSQGLAHPANGASSQGAPGRNNQFSPSPVPSPKRRRHWVIAGSSILVLVVIAGAILRLVAIDHFLAPAQKPAPTPVLSVLPSDLSDGETVFDKNRADGQLKQEAAQRLQTSDLAHAQALLEMGVEEDSSDAEALVYLQDIAVRQGSQPYITLVASVCLSGNDEDLIYKGRDTLQGLYIAQKGYNDDAGSNQALLRLLIADSCAAQPQKLALDIVRAAHQQNIVGVVGHPLDKQGAQILNQVHVPVISSQTSCDAPTGATNFYSVTPSLPDEIQAAVNYINSQHASSVGLYYDASNPYSNCLYNELLDRLHALPKTYSAGLSYSIENLANEAQLMHFDFIYFAGGPTDAKTLLDDLHAIHYQVPIVGSDILYEYVDFPANQRNDFNGIIFTAFGYHDQWNEERCTSVRQNQQSSFFCAYDRVFNPALFHQLPVFYGYTFADSDAVMGYDAVNLLLQASGKLLTKISFASAQFLQALKVFTQHHQFMAVSGPITFGSDCYPTNAPVLILSVKPAGVYLEQTYR